MNIQNPTEVKDFNQYPDASGHFGIHGDALSLKP